jgi:predicted nucleic acid-binding protein
MTRIYLDACCLNRPFDDQRQDRIRLEAEAVLLILTHLETGKWQWIGSEVLDFEIEQTPDPQRRHRVKLLAAYAHHRVLVEQAEIERAQQLEALGFRSFDALHLACAESGGADVFLTTDDKLLRRATRLPGQLNVQVENPLTWLKEATEQ